MLDAERDAFLLDVNVQHLGLDHFALAIALDGFLAGDAPVQVGQVHHAVDVVVQADEQTEFGGVLDFALDGRADRVGSDERIPGIVLGLLETQRDPALGAVDVQDHDVHFLRGGDDLARMDVLLGPGHFRDVHQAFNAGFQLNECAVVGDVGDAAGVFGTGGIFGFDAIPRIGLQLLHAEADALGVRVDLDDLHLDGVADGEHLRRVRDALPRHVGDVKQAIDAAQVHECAVVGDVLDDAVADFTLLQLTNQLGALFGAGFFQDRTTRDDDVAARAVHLEDLERLFLAHQRADVAHGADVDLRAGQEGRCAAEVDGEATLDATDDGTVDRHAFCEDDFQTGPGFFATGLVAADDGFTQGVLDALEVDFHVVADLRDHRAFADAELTGRDTTFGLQTHVDDDDVFFDADDAAVDDLAFAEVTTLELLVEQGREIVARGVEGICHEALVFPNGFWRVTGRPRAR